MLHIIVDQTLVHALLLERNASAAGPDNIPGVMLNKLAGSPAHPSIINHYLSAISVFREGSRHLAASLLIVSLYRKRKSARSQLLKTR